VRYNVPSPSNAGKILDSFRKAGYTPTQTAGNVRAESQANLAPRITNLDDLRKYEAKLNTPYANARPQTENREVGVLRNITTSTQVAPTPTQTAQVLQKQAEKPSVLDPEKAKFAAQMAKNFQDNADKVKAQQVYYDKLKAEIERKTSSSRIIPNQDITEALFNGAKQSAQDILDQSLATMRALHGDKPSSFEVSSKIQPIVKSSWDQGYIDASNKIKAAQGNAGNIARSFSPVSDYYANTPVSAFPSFSNTIPGNRYAGSNFTNTLFDTFGNPFTDSFS